MNDTCHILLLEDDFALSTEIKTFLNHHHYTCDCVYDGTMVARQLKLAPYDVLILDINVPGMSGLQVIQAVREQDKKTPILMLTAFGEIEDKVSAFQSGADDYLVKPFHFDELLVRIKALLRRKEIPQISEDLYTVSDLVIDFEQMKVSRAGHQISLTPKEFKLLSILAKAHGKVVPKQAIADELWDYHIETNQNTIEVYINFLRKKIDKEYEPRLIHTRVGYGYYLKEGEEQ
jgi:DNA-binding response OmpR family regulator